MATPTARIPLTRRPLADQAAEALLSRIAAGEWEVGARLPSESALVAQLGVGRSTVREAVRQLAGRGVVETRQGAGAFLTALAPHEDWNTVLRRAHITAVLEARCAIEAEAASLAALRRTPEDVRSIRRALSARARLLPRPSATAQDERPGRQEGAAPPPAERAEDSAPAAGLCADPGAGPLGAAEAPPADSGEPILAPTAPADARALVEADMRFHRAVIAAAHNEVLLSVFDGLTDRLRTAMEEMLDLTGRLDWTTDETGHVRLAEAVICGRDAEAARCARAHLTALGSGLETDGAPSAPA
ncbi:FadR/GntR family transcriptional regulator [Brevibacterium album]|uniref:FadR/GntR family transcriptional regulator n=1 Tax=Brevibacterium album TaxID=417948 RepID=UPI00040A851B|nr:GntR family transcriptional regulator [Brevibacterium album]